MKCHLSTLPLIALLAVALPAAAAGPSASDKQPQRIKKCQDAQGNWHYGDNAAEQCARSKVIELDQRGVQRKEIAAPLTEAQLKARAADRAAEAEQKRLEAEQKVRDEQLLASYTHEDDILYISKRKTADIDAQIRSTEETLKSLRKTQEKLQAQAADEQRATNKVSAQTEKALANNQAQIARQEASIQKMKSDQERMTAQYQADLERFRELKRRAPAPSPATAGSAASAAPAKK